MSRSAMVVTIVAISVCTQNNGLKEIKVSTWIVYLASGGLGQVGHVEDRHQSRELFASDGGGGENLLDLRNQLQEGF